jgi:hypothetical protein
MTSAISHTIPLVSATTARQIDAMCDTVEDSLKAGHAYQLEDCLAAFEEASRPALLRQILLMEW